MVRLILISLLFVASLVNFFPVPSKEVWYVGIAIPEFPWIFILLSMILLTWSFFKIRFKKACLIIGTITFIILCSPIVRAFSVGSDLENKIQSSFPINDGNIKNFHQSRPFSFFQMFTGNGAKKFLLKHIVMPLIQALLLILIFPHHQFQVFVPVWL